MMCHQQQQNVPQIAVLSSIRAHDRTWQSGEPLNEGPLRWSNGWDAARCILGVLLMLFKL
jgi:hypothetical protein